PHQNHPQKPSRAVACHGGPSLGDPVGGRSLASCDRQRVRLRVLGIGASQWPRPVTSAPTSESTAGILGISGGLIAVAATGRGRRRLSLIAPSAIAISVRTWRGMPTGKAG